MTIWVVVADAAKARVFSAENRNSPLQEVEDFDFPASRMRDQDLESDAPGRSYDSVGGGRHAMGKEVNIHQQQADHFARALCERVVAGMNGHQIEKLYLVAPPAFLGLLRQRLPKNCQTLVAGEVNKDLVEHSIADIRQHLPDFL
jgi:protein required for attachment to host cells